MTFSWPAELPRVLDEEWTRAELDTLALKYDTVENHGWYRNLEPTLDELVAFLRDGMTMIDYSGGTGILLDKLIQRIPARQAGYLLVDSSPKFLRLALEKLRGDPRVAFRLIHFLKAEKRLQLLDEVVPASLLGGFDAITSTNAVHLYYDLGDTLRSWHRALRPGGRAMVQSGNIRNPAARPGDWIIDATVHQIDAAARGLVAERAEYARFRAALDDDATMLAYQALRDKFFLPVRPLAYYLEQLGEAGFTVVDVATRSIQAEVAEWYDFLAAYHEGVLGWAGGSRRISGAEPTEEVVALRLALIREALDRVFDGKPSFQASWTYITATAAPGTRS
jgi:SAM-dependent methyltransferase